MIRRSYKIKTKHTFFSLSWLLILCTACSQGISGQVNQNKVEEKAKVAVKTNRASPMTSAQTIKESPSLTLLLEKMEIITQPPYKLLGPKDDFVSHAKVDPEWQKVKDKLEKSSNLLFNLWVSKTVEEFSEEFKNVWRNPNQAEMMLKWDTIEISEQAEDGTEVKSKIKVPQNLAQLTKRLPKSNYN